MIGLARQYPHRFITFYSDEASFYRQPTQAWLWHRMGRRQPKLIYSHRSNTVMRVVGYLNPLSGKVHTWDYSKVTAVRFAKTLDSIAQLYPDHEKIYIILDNWPVHFHSKVKELLENNSRLELVPLPTYSPWLNLIEKVWRWCKQGLTHAHPWADDFTMFRENVRDFLKPLEGGSKEILRYVGC